ASGTSAYREMWKPDGSLIDWRCFLTASAFGPVCGMVGILGVAPVVLNWPSLSRLDGGVWAKAVVDISAAVDSAISRCVRMAKPPGHSELVVQVFYAPMAGSASHIIATVQVEVAPRDDMARRPATHVFGSHRDRDGALPIPAPGS